MGCIAVEGMRFYAYHGYYEEEQKIGGFYSVDVYIDADLNAAAAGDDLSKTINYETIHLVCQTVMKKKAKLLETVLAHIALGIKHQFSDLESVKIRVTKENPPLRKPTARTYVEDTFEFVIECGRCGGPVTCYKDQTCWCMKASRIPSKTLEHLRAQYGGCLCAECLEYYAN